MARDINPALAAELGGFISAHQAQFDQIPGLQYQLLELAALALCSEHYRRNGYTVTPHNLDGTHFRVKTGSRGKPWNYSWFLCERADSRFEIHANLSVRGSHDDDGVYCVDVAVTEEQCLPTQPGQQKTFRAVDNARLVTFAEAKKLVAYPMLLAQFLGIVHEVKYRFVSGRRRPRGFVSADHFDPALITIGYLQPNSALIREGFRNRGYRITVVADADFELSRLRQDSRRESPFRQ